MVRDKKKTKSENENLENIEMLYDFKNSKVNDADADI